MPIQLIESKIHKSHLAELANERFGDLVKAVVDIKRRVMVIGAELHSDEEALLIEQGSEQQDLWGINLYPDKPSEDWSEFDSVINIRPAQGNRSCGVNNLQTQEMIKEIISQLVHDS